MTFRTETDACVTITRPSVAVYAALRRCTRSYLRTSTRPLVDPRVRIPDRLVRALRIGPSWGSAPPMRKVSERQGGMPLL